MYTQLSAVGRKTIGDRKLNTFLDHPHHMYLDETSESLAHPASFANWNDYTHIAKVGKGVIEGHEGGRVDAIVIGEQEVGHRRKGNR